MKIAMVASEVVPFAKTGGLADVVGALPLALNDCGQEVIIIMPKYKCITDSKFRVSRVSKDVSSANIGENIKVYFMENDLYFNRDGLYMNKDGDYKDNLERFAFFCRRALDWLKEIDFAADILHLHDWQASLTAVYLKNLYSKEPFYSRMKSILTIHNLGYQGLFPKNEFAKLGLESSLFSVSGLEFYNQINLLKGGIIFSDFINTVSPTYAKEIQTEELGFGLDGLLKQRKNVLSGIVNGLDYYVWDPNTDRFIVQNFSARNIEDKSFNKEKLQAICGLPVNKDIPVLGVVSRLVEAKGFDILAQSLDEICKMNVQIVILGTGDLKYHQILGAAQKRYPSIISLNLKFDDPLAHKIYAGSDIFLMLSKYEPCGLGQLISLHYGTIPLVFKTGGLADTINKNNGFVFTNYTKEEFIRLVKKVAVIFQDKKKWMRLINNAMKCNFSWEDSAKKYIQLYAQAKEK
ncbi:MAG: glycogen synthase GlgA [Candidatus Omnitrophica bacterium]|nr:glycogen synthase GlgA [Candidatus Omnitrophota bacterium]MBU1922749.1 glycogen synthase GlgA [Candidatus Omnitrophota bacterium]